MTLLKPRCPVYLSMLALLEPGSDAPTVVDLADQGSRPPSSAGLEHRGFETFGASVDAWRRQSGIPRPSSASRASITAATVARPLLGAGRWDRARLGVVTASTSSAACSAVSFETRGLSESWELVDPLLLPSTLPSALATQVAMSVGARGFAVSFLIGLLGVFHAIEAAILGLARGDADAVLVVAADEQTIVQRTAHEHLGWEPTPGEFAGALALERRSNRGYQVAFLGQGTPSDPVVPDDWAADPRFDARASHRGPSLQCGIAFRAIRDAALSGHPRVVATGVVPGLGSASLGLIAVDQEASH